MKKLLSPVFFIFIVTILFWQFFLKGFLPIPSDTIVGLYYPFREIYLKTNPNGVPFKNFLITDPVRQQYPWKNLAISIIKKDQLPTWNPYNLAGTPLLANFQSSPFYPLNILLFLPPFEISWSIFIFLQPLLSGVFLYFYLDHMKLKKPASLLGAIAFSLSGFSTAWMEWGTVIHTALWLPLILLSIDKLILISKSKKIWWLCIFTLSLISSFFAGHLQIFFYLLIFSLTYLIGRLVQKRKGIKYWIPLAVSLLVVLTITLIQWMPTLKFVSLSARNLDIADWRLPGWFIPWQNILQFMVPDFFGNPTTLNYWGIWNYGEFIGYIGIIPLIMSFLALFFRRDKKTLFFGIAFFLSLIFALPTFFAKIPFELSTPFISTSQPTRLLFIIDFTLSVLCALGMDYFIKIKNKTNIIYILGFSLIIFLGLWVFVLISHDVLMLDSLKVIKQNLILPTAIFITSALLIILIIYFPNKNRYGKNVIKIFFICLLLLTIFDLLRFSWKFNPFTKKEYLFPSTSVTSFLQKQKGLFRIMATDERILPPNFSIMYKLQTLDGYDPLYPKRYGEFIAAYSRKNPNINSPFGFNRIIAPKYYSSKITDLLNVKYILSLESLDDKNLNKIFSDGTLKIYENINVYARTFFVNSTIMSNSKQNTINDIYDSKFDLSKVAVVENARSLKSSWTLGKSEIINYKENKVIIKTDNLGDGFMVLTDSYYPTWHVKIDGKEGMIYLTDFNFRGVVVPQGKHVVEFYNTLF